LIPIQNFSYFSYPLQAALVISGEEKEHISIITNEIDNLIATIETRHDSLPDLAYPFLFFRRE